MVYHGAQVSRSSPDVSVSDSAFPESCDEGGDFGNLISLYINGRFAVDADDLTCDTGFGILVPIVLATAADDILPRNVLTRDRTSNVPVGVACDKSGQGSSSIQRFA